MDVVAYSPFIKDIQSLHKASLPLLASTNQLLALIVPVMMPDTSGSTDLKIQVGFGIFAVFSRFIAVANLHPRNSLRATWFRSIRNCLSTAL